MIWIDLGNPRPRAEAANYDPHVWKVVSTTPLPIPEQVPNDSLVSVLERRRTIRHFSKLTAEGLGSLLWLTFRQEKTGHDHLGFDLSQRPIPSAGAIHPIHILISNRASNCWLRYDPLFHTLEQLEIECDTAIKEVDNVLPTMDGEVMLLVAEPGKTGAKYEFPISLIWRDAGVLLGNLALTSELLNLAFCPLGTTGEPWASSFSEQGLLNGAGMAVIGSLPLSVLG